MFYVACYAYTACNACLRRTVHLSRGDSLLSHPPSLFFGTEKECGEAEFDKSPKTATTSALFQVCVAMNCNLEVSRPGDSSTVGYAWRS